MEPMDEPSAVLGESDPHRSSRSRLATALGLAVALLAVVPDAWAQLPPLLEMSGQYLPASDIGSVPGLRAQVATYDASVSVPVPVGRSAYLLPGATYHAESVSYDRMPPGFQQVRALHAADLSLLYTQAVSERWWVSLRGSAGLAGDFAAIDSGHLRVGGFAMATYAFGEHLVLGGGALVTHAFGELHPLPMVYLDWRARPWLRIEANLPVMAEVRTTLANRVELGVLADVNGNEYAIRDSAIRSDPQCSSGGGCMDHISLAVVAAGAVARVRLFSTLWLSATAGRTLWRRFEQKDADNRLLAGGREDLPSEFLFRGGLVWRLPGS